MSESPPQFDSSGSQSDGVPVIPPPPNHKQTSGSPPAVNANPVDSAATHPRPSRSVVPPPPPPRASLPPVRKPGSAGQVESGVGSAQGIRWRGELDKVGRGKNKTSPSSAPPQTASTKLPDATDPELDREPDTITRGAPPWLISLVIHLIFLLILAFITTPAGSGLGKLILTMGSSDSNSPVELQEFSITTQEFPVDADSTIESDEIIEIENPLETVTLADAPEFTPVLAGLGPEPLTASAATMFGGRSGATKQALLALYGGTAETQDAVRLGLLWLKKNQGRRGGWSMQGPYDDGSHSENECAATAMAMLAFLGDGHTHLGGDYTKEMDKAMRFLVSKQDRAGFMASKARGHERAYAQAQATIALCELYGMTNDSWLRPRAQLALDYAAKAQVDLGGWRYNPADQDADTSVTGWFLLALKSGQSAGLEVNGSVIRNVGDFLDTVQSYGGAAYGYQQRSNPTESMTAEGLLCRQYLGWKRDHLPLIQGVEALSMDYPFNIDDRNVYYWYYATQVLHHFGGSHWRMWNETMREQLPAAQVKDGRETGSWPPQADEYGSFYGRLYTTCLSIYCLEVYYRHMPLYKDID